MIGVGERTTEIRLSQSEASALLDRLLPALTHEPGDTHNLPEMVERLSDSLWLSGWAKNNVTIELEPKERLELIAALTTAFAECEAGHEEPELLELIIDRLSGEPANQS